MTATPNLTKTCTICGLLKPLSAFLEIGGPEGTTYGNICSTCRKANLDKVEAPKDPDEATTSTTEHKFDLKKKMQEDKEKNQLRKERDENYFEERDEKEEKQLQKTEKTHDIAKGEKEHRENYLKRGSFLDGIKNKSSTSGRVFGGTEHAAEAGKFNFAAPVEDTRTPQLKHSSAIFTALKVRLGESAAIGSHQAKQAAAKKESAKDQIIEEIKNNWGPSSRKR